MFNPLRPEQLIAVMSAKLRDAGRTDGPLSSFEREQMLSAYSLGRHLRGELAALAIFEQQTRDLAGLLQERAEELARGDGDAPAWADRVVRAADAVGSGGVESVGAALAELFADLRHVRERWATELVAEMHSALRAIVRTEVDALARATS